MDPSRSSRRGPGSFLPDSLPPVSTLTTFLHLIAEILFLCAEILRCYVLWAGASVTRLALTPERTPLKFPFFFLTLSRLVALSRTEPFLHEDLSRIVRAAPSTVAAPCDIPYFDFRDHFFFFPSLVCEHVFPLFPWSGMHFLRSGACAPAHRTVKPTGARALGLGRLPFLFLSRNFFSKACHVGSFLARRVYLCAGTTLPFLWIRPFSSLCRPWSLRNTGRIFRDQVSAYIEGPFCKKEPLVR